MTEKNDCERDYIKEAFDKLYNLVMPYINLTQFADADTAFKELDKKVHSEIYILKKCLAESDRAVGAGLTRSKVLLERISDLEKKLNNERKHSEELANVNGQLASENADLKANTSRLTLLENSRTAWRSRAQHAEKRVMELNKKISELEKELAQARNSTELHLRQENDRLREVIDGLEKEINTLKKKIQDLEEESTSLDEDVDALVAENVDLHERLSSDKKSIETLEKVNCILRGDNETLWARLKKCEKCAFDISKRPWHGDGNAMTGECGKSLVEAIEFQNKRIEELEAEKARLKEAYDIHETTIKKENVDLSPGHEFEFGDEVFVPWSDAPYMYVKTGLLYNTRTKRLVYVGKDQHLKWFGEKFAIV